MVRHVRLTVRGGRQRIGNCPAPTGVASRPGPDGLAEPAAAGLARHRRPRSLTGPRPVCPTACPHGARPRLRAGIGLSSAISPCSRPACRQFNVAGVESQARPACRSAGDVPGAAQAVVLASSVAEPWAHRRPTGAGSAEDWTPSRPTGGCHRVRRALGRLGSWTLSEAWNRSSPRRSGDAEPTLWPWSAVPVAATLAGHRRTRRAQQRQPCCGWIHTLTTRRWPR